MLYYFVAAKTSEFKTIKVIVAVPWMVMDRIVNLVGKISDLKITKFRQFIFLETCTSSVNKSMNATTSMIFVISLRDSMSTDIQLLINGIPTLIADWNNFNPYKPVANFIVTTFIQIDNLYYIYTDLFLYQIDLLRYLKGLILFNVNDNQPVLSAIYAVQSYAPEMIPGSLVFVLTDSLPNDGVANDYRLSPNNNESMLIAQTLQWNNRIIFLISKRENSSVNSSDPAFDAYRRVSRAVHGDVLIMNKQELNDTLYWMICYYYQMADIHALYGVNSQIGLALDSDYATESVYIVISVEINQTLSTIKTATGSLLSPQFNTSLFAIYRTSYFQTKSLTLAPNSDTYNVRIFINSANSVWISYHKNPTVDVGDSYALADIQYATGYSNWPAVNKIQFYIAPSNDDRTPIGKTYQGSLRNESCTFPWAYGSIDQCTPGPYTQFVKLYGANNTEYFRILPGYCFSQN
ncbi:hypothetical protein WR25_20664 isoform C [Diploscapter pachys]|uniref:Uncharacterized protein n=1 Tax=Diploscapter pachys TaxID=2018661 RepID=A0A2A2L2Q7_9BILA|nr:hypothetical protein WR25_20664 isoform C [Diploscapter pachys]